MRLLHSLKYQIAITIFFLETLLLAFVIWQTQSVSYEKSKQAIDTQDRLIVDLLSEASRTALLINEFAGLQAMFEEAAENPHVFFIALTNRNNLTVASSDIQMFNQEPRDFSHSDDAYWKVSELEDFSSRKGILYIKFSSREIQQALQQSLKRGVLSGLVGMLLIAMVGLFFGFILTRRLDRVARHTERLAAGDLLKPLQIEGQDELNRLAGSLNEMARKLDESFSRIEQMAFHDDLTGLANRVEFTNRLKQALKRAKAKNEQHALMFLDLDQFKVVNDTCGHEAGDQLLIELSGTMLQQLRGRDTLARLGGDEFGVIVEHCQFPECKIVAEKIRAVVSEFRFVWGIEEFTVGISIGLVMIDSSCQDINNLMKLADMACYAAKDQGGNSIQVANAGDTEISDRAIEMSWVHRLNRAIEHDEWILHWQKILALEEQDKGLQCYEFLLRLKENETLIRPSSFMQAAERYNLTQKIDKKVIEKAFELIPGLQNKDENCLFFINLSAMTIVDDEFLEHLLNLLEKKSIDPRMLCFEITETAAVRYMDKAIGFIQQLRDKGFQFALDDFGTGMCSFSYLTRFPVDFVKIDGCFVTHMASNELNRSIIESVNMLSHKAGFRTIAECVESEDQLELLKKLGIDFAQGYAIHRPQQIPSNKKK